MLIGSFLTARWWTVVAAAGVILAALYLLWAYQRVFHGEPDDDNTSFPELQPGRRPRCCCRSSASSCSRGVYPKPMLDRIEPSVDALVTHVRSAAGTTIRACPSRPPRSSRRGSTQRRRSRTTEAETLRRRRDRRRRPVFQGPPVDWFALCPLLVLLGGALVLLVVGALDAALADAAGTRSFTAATAGAATGAVDGAVGRRHGRGSAARWSATRCALDRFALLGTITICVAVLLDQPRHRRLPAPGGPRRSGDLRRCTCWPAIGGIVMVSANDLIVLFLGLEMLSISFYVLAASHRRRIESQESGIKYFVLGGFSSAFFLYGDRAHLRRHRQHQLRRDRRSRSTRSVPAERKDALVLAGVALLLVGLAFKVAAVPFHFWTPDVYEGAPTPVTAFMASAGKVAAFAAMLRVLVFALPNWRDDWRPGDLGDRRAHARRRLGAGGRADERQADARVLVDQPRRLHPRRRRGGRAPRRRARAGRRACRRRCCTCCCTRCWCSARSRSSRWCPAPATRRPDLVVVPRAGAQRTPALALGDDRAAARAGRRAADVGVRRQVRRDPGGRRGAQLRDRDHRDGVGRDRRVPLPADHDQHVDHRSGVG